MSDEGEYYSAKVDDCMSSIASQFGFFWETLWFHPKNGDLRKLRKNPNVLLEDDQVWIPQKQIKQVEAPVDALHTFQVKGVTTMFRLRFTDSGKPRANIPYVLTIDGNLFTGSTDSDGKIEVPIPPNAQEGTLVLGQGKEAKTYTLDLGSIAPVSVRSSRPRTCSPSGALPARMSFRASSPVTHRSASIMGGPWVRW